MVSGCYFLAFQLCLCLLQCGSQLIGAGGFLAAAADAIYSCDDIVDVHTLDKSMEMVHVKELLSLTGYIRGGCSPVGMKKQYPTHFDETCILYDEIAVSAGARGHQMIIPPEALAKLIGAEFEDITK